MALINKIRQRAGLAVGVVAVAMGLFIVGTDLFSSTSSIFNKNDTTIGEIAGEDVDYDEFQQELDQMIYNFTMRSNRKPTENELYTLRQQAWEMLIVKHAFQQQYDELGIEVTDDEHWDMIQGNNIDFNIRQSFANPETGEFDRNQVLMYLQQLNQVEDDNPQKLAWSIFEESLNPGRMRIKYDNLLVQSTYSTDAEAQNFYQSETSVAEIKYLYVPYYTIDDSLISYTDSDLRAYYNENKDKFETEESRGISYVTMPVIPSSADTAYFKEEIDRVRQEFIEASDDSLFAKARSDTRNFYGTYTIDQLPERLLANYSNLSEGDVRGPYYVNGFLTLYKVSDIGEDTVESAKARHILIKWENDTDEAKAEARAKANRIIRQVRGGADFAELARTESEDPGSGAKGGDLGWFGRGKMVKPFEDAVFNANSTGLISQPIESQFGYHIIDVTEVSNNTSFKVATIAREITPSDETVNEAYLKTELLASSSSNYDSFVENAQKEGYKVSTAENIGKNDRRINNLSDARPVIQWMYRDASVGDVSSVFELDDEFVVAALTSQISEGVSDFENVKDQIENIVKNEKKAEYISQKLNSIEGTLDEKASEFGPEANTYSSSDLKLSSNSIPNVGFVPKVVGTVFGMEEGQVSQPIDTENGVVVVELQALTPAPEIADYSSYKSQLEQRNSGQASYGISEAIRENADIQDFRYRFF